MIKVSEAIKNAVTEGKTSYRRLARSTGYDHAFLHSIAQERKNPPSKKEFYEALADALQLEVDGFLEFARMKLDILLDNNEEVLEMILETAQAMTGTLGRDESLIEEVQEEKSPGLVMDIEEYRAYINGAPLDFTFTEFQIMAYLYKHSGKTLTREAILREVWGYSYLGDSRTIDVHIRRIRAKLGPRYQDLVETVRNIGYRLTKGTL